jgi:broad specificity phosphatase PhoE
LARARIFLIRHGRTLWNVERRRQGREDIPLDEEGRVQADSLCAALAHERIDAIYASPLVRARDTAEPTARAHDLSVQIDEDLLELDFGAFSGSLRSEVKVKLRKDYLYTPLPDGESLFDAWRRADRFAARIGPALHDGQTLLIAGHQRLNRLLLGVLEGRTLEAAARCNTYRPAPGALVDIRLEASDGGLRVATIEGDAHDPDAD